MDAFRQGFARQTRLMFAHPRYLAMLGLLLVMSFMSMESYHSKTVRKLPVAVIDMDNSKISRTMRTMLAAAQEIRAIPWEMNGWDDAQEKIISGELAGVVLIPADFSTRIKKGRKAELSAYIDGSNILIGKNVYKGVSKSAGTVAAGIQLTLVKKLGERKDRAMARVVPIAVDEDFNFNASANYTVYMAPGLVFFFLHIYVLIVAGSIFLPETRTEKETMLLGRLAASFLGCFVIGLIFFYAYLPIESLAPRSGPAPVLATLAAFIALDLACAAALMRLIPNPMVAFEITVVIGMLSLMFSGITWPTDMFPAVIRIFSEAIPFTPFARGFRMFLHEPIGLFDMGSVFSRFALQALIFAVLIAAGFIVRRYAPLAKKARS